MSLINAPEVTRGLAVVFICAALFSFIATGCGKKGPPRPPELHPTNNAPQGAGVEKAT